MKVNRQLIKTQGFATFGLFGNIIIGVIGAVFGGMTLNIFDDQFYGFFGIFLRAAVGAFILVFCANIVHVVAGPKRY